MTEQLVVNLDPLGTLDPVLMVLVESVDFLVPGFTLTYTHKSGLWSATDPVSDCAYEEANPYSAIETMLESIDHAEKDL